MPGKGRQGHGRPISMRCSSTRIIRLNGRLTDIGRRGSCGAGLLVDTYRRPAGRGCGVASGAIKDHGHGEAIPWRRRRGINGTVNVTTREIAADFPKIVGWPPHIITCLAEVHAGWGVVPGASFLKVIENHGTRGVRCGGSCGHARSISDGWSLLKGCCRRESSRRSKRWSGRVRWCGSRV